MKAVMSDSKNMAMLKKISTRLAEECSTLRFALPVAAVYNPLVYAIKPYNLYLKLAGPAPKKVIFLGMNPGPWGMAQTGVPFGEIAAVRDWLGIEAAVDKPGREHPKRPIEGFACHRSEVSGRRLWGLFRERFATPAAFFRDHFVANYCPLVFMDSGGANITPDKLPAEETALLFKICDQALADTIKLLKPRWVIGIGAFAKKRIDLVQKKYFSEKADIVFSPAQILHPSPASPKANAGWDREVIKILTELGVWK
ncbi:MAG: single-stranded DNA-binding protein [Treponema sp.]|nr:single-stranded DNA-binding protein [Treponema sp.]